MKISLICTNMSTVKTEPRALTLMLGQPFGVGDLIVDLLYLGPRPFGGDRLVLNPMAA